MINLKKNVILKVVTAATVQQWYKNFWHFSENDVLKIEKFINSRKQNKKLNIIGFHYNI
jgi:hypothetical protein